MQIHPCWFLLTAIGIPASPVGGQVPPTVRHYYDSVAALIPSFAGYPAAHRFRGALHPIDLSAPRWARGYRTAFRRGVAAGPNFDGHYVIVEWGCGTSCQVYAVVDAETGRVFPECLQTSIGAEYRIGSALVVADPLGAIIEDVAGDSALLHSGAEGTPAAYRWTGSHFAPVGGGDHPHVLPQGPPAS